MTKAGILVVDDDANIRAVLADIIGDEGHTVLEAENGAEALEMASTHAPSLIFLDMRMPVMDGWQFARAYRESPGPHAPIVVMTAAHNARQWCDEVKGDDCLSKPFELVRVLDTIQRFVD